MSVSSVLNHEMRRWLDAIENETTHSLKIISDHFSSSGITMDEKFKTTLLESGNCRMIEVFKRLEMTLICEQQFKACKTGAEKEIGMQVTNFGSVPYESNGTKNISNGTQITLNHHNDHNDHNGHNNDDNAMNPDDNTTFDELMVDLNGYSNGFLNDSSTLNDRSAIVDLTENRLKLRKEWMCFYCNEAYIRNVKFPKIEDLLEHWTLEHSLSKPQFIFQPVDLINCSFENCRYYSSFNGLQNHYKTKHSNANFVAAKDNRCLLCLCKANDLQKHICPELQRVQRLKLQNPIRYTNEYLKELQAVNPPVNKEFICKHCDRMFNSAEEFMSHHHEQHGDKMIQNEIQLDKKQLVVGLICGCCQISISPNSHVDHLRTVVQKRWKKTNTWDVWFQHFEKYWLKTKVIFKNGLCVFKYNLISTDFGGDPGYKNLARNLFKSLKES